MIHPFADCVDSRARKPRASGDDPPHDTPAEYQRQVNPARAGMIPRTDGYTYLELRKPRASGDDPCSISDSKDDNS